MKLGLKKYLLPAGIIIAVLLVAAVALISIDNMHKKPVVSEEQGLTEAQIREGLSMDHMKMDDASMSHDSMMKAGQ